MGYVVKRYVNDRLVTAQELSLHMINNPVILDTVDEVITKSNMRYHNNNGLLKMDCER